MPITHRQYVISARDALVLHAGTSDTVFLNVCFSREGVTEANRPQRIAGAVDVNLSRHLQGEGGGTRGQRPLPEPTALAADIAAWGINQASTVIVSSTDAPAAAARAWYVLRWAGINDVRYLDGGLPAWMKAGGPVSQCAQTPAPGNFLLPERRGVSPSSATEVARRLAGRLKVFDVRDEATYLGDGTLRSGHIPGSINLPAKQFIEQDNTLIKPAAIRALLKQHGVGRGDRPVVYCGAGVLASLATLAFATAGIEADLFIGSFSAWSADASLRVTNKG